MNPTGNVRTAGNPQYPGDTHHSQTEGETMKERDKHLKDFDALQKGFLDNLLLDECRELFAAMSREQRALVRCALSFGFLKGRGGR